MVRFFYWFGVLMAVEYAIVLLVLLAGPWLIEAEEVAWVVALVMHAFAPLAAGIVAACFTLRHRALAARGRRRVQAAE